MSFRWHQDVVFIAHTTESFEDDIVCILCFREKEDIWKRTLRSPKIPHLTHHSWYNSSTWACIVRAGSVVYTSFCSCSVIRITGHSPLHVGIPKREGVPGIGRIFQLHSPFALGCTQQSLGSRLLLWSWHDVYCMVTSRRSSITFSAEGAAGENASLSRLICRGGLLPFGFV